MGGYKTGRVQDWAGTSPAPTVWLRGMGWGWEQNGYMGGGIMQYDPQKHHRRSIRLKGYDYALPGSYFVTICAQHFACLFGQVVDGVMILNDAGRMVERVWADIPERFPAVRSDIHVIMPNHFHAIITITAPSSGDTRRGDPCGRPLVIAPDGGDTPDWADTPDGTGTRPAPTMPDRVDTPDRADTPVEPVLGEVVGAFKSITTGEYIVGVRTKGWPLFDKRIWQRNYWEHIVCNEREYQRIYDYIENNPACWKKDQLRPDAPPNLFNQGKTQ
ncbi:MAG: hypothetical protein JXA33_05280 [Anaerolineae bacterium]|nr:hypothetical protein [Anaerolineae bacterium]